MSSPNIAFITGCATGIGRALAVELSQQKHNGDAAYKVYATDSKPQALNDLTAYGIATLELDVLSPESIKAAIDAVLSEEGRIDLLVCNAGIHCGGFMAEIDYSDVEKIFAINVHGTFRVIQAVGPHMMARRQGRIATMCDAQSWFARPFNAPYQGSKAAVAMMSEGLSLELASFGVSVSSICAGWVQTDLIANGLTDFKRYRQADSFYSQVTGYFKQLLDNFATLGPSAEQAAKDIAKGLAEEQLPRYIYTGDSIWATLRRGFVQQWLFNGVVAKQILHETGLAQLGRDLPASPHIPLNVQKAQ